jgi:acetylornithine deacetylase
MECRISFVPGENEESVKKEIEERIAETATRVPWFKEHPPQVEWFGWHANPWLQDEEDPFIRLVQQSGKDVMGVEPPIVGKPAGLDTRFCKEFGISACAFGPNGGNIHGIDEYVDLQSVVQTTKVIALTMLHWCR